MPKERLAKQACGGLDPSGPSTTASARSEARLTHNLKFVWLLIGVGIVIVAGVFVLGSISMAIMTLVFAGLIVFILRKPVDWLVGKGVPRILATLVLVLAALGVLIALVVSFIPLILDQTTGFVQQISSHVSTVQQWWNELKVSNPDLAGSAIVQSWLEDIGKNVADWFGRVQITLIAAIGNSAMGVFNAIIVVLTSFIVAFWILLGYDKMVREMHALFSPGTQYYVTLVTTIFSRSLSGFLKGTIIGAIISGIIAGIAYWLIGMPFPLVLGLLAGLLSIIAYLGPFIMAVIAAIIALFISPLAVVLAVVVSAVVPWVVGTFVSPRIMESTVSLHPGIILLAILAGGAVGGPLGMIAAIPVAAAAKCLIVYFHESYTGRQLVSPDGELFAGQASARIDPVADATDGYLTHEALLAMVDSIEESVRHVPASQARAYRVRVGAGSPCPAPAAAQQGAGAPQAAEAPRDADPEDAEDADASAAGACAAQGAATAGKDEASGPGGRMG